MKGREEKERKGGEFDSCGYFHADRLLWGECVNGIS